MSIISISGILK